LEGGIHVDAGQIKYVDTQSYWFRSAWKTVDWYVHRCRGELPMIHATERATTASKFVPVASVRLSEELHELLQKAQYRQRA
jgi:hypothetical protein